MGIRRQPCIRVTMPIGAGVRWTVIAYSPSRGDGIWRRTTHHVDLTWKASTRAGGSHTRRRGQPEWRAGPALLIQSQLRDSDLESAPAWRICRHQPSRWKGRDDGQSQDPYKGLAPRSGRRRPCTQGDRRNQYTEASTRPDTHPRVRRPNVSSRRRRVHMLAAVSPWTWRH